MSAIVVMLVVIAGAAYLIHREVAYLKPARNFSFERWDYIMGRVHIGEDWQAAAARYDEQHGLSD